MAVGGDLATRGFIPIPSQYQVYQSYTVDPQWQTKFTIIWTSILAFSLLLSVPWLIRSSRNGRLYAGLAITETLTSTDQRKDAYAQHAYSRPSNNLFIRAVRGIEAIWQSAALFTLPMPNLRWWKSQVGDCCRRAYFSLSISQIFIVLAYTGIVVACIVTGAQLVENPNRPGFIGLATLPVILALSIKSPLPLPVFLPTLSYEHYNFLHRWAGRVLFMAVSIHGGMWINQFITTDQYDQLTAAKSKRGILAYGLLGGIVITSLKPVRRLFYQLFWVAHVSLFVGFFAAISYHTPYSQPWVIACASIYAYDLAVRMFRYRIKSAVLVPVDETLTMIHIPDCDAGWLPTQHVMLRVLSGSGAFESHPFTITNAPARSPSSPRGIILYAKVSGDWTRKLHNMARTVSLETGQEIEEHEAFLEKERAGQADIRDHPGKQVNVTLDGPYGGLKLDLGAVKNVLLVGGGSGVTFVLGGIEEALRVKAQGGRTSKVDVAWVVKDISTVHALAPTLAHLQTRATASGLHLNYEIFLSNPPSPLPVIPDCLRGFTSMSPYRPEVAQLVREALPCPAADGEAPADPANSGHGGGLAVIACGPEGLVMEGRNAVASLSIAERVACGGVEFHGEMYCL